MTADSPAQADFGAWVGREQTARERIDPRAVTALAATLDWEQPPQEGDILPPGWQWLFFNPRVRSSELGADGHPLRAAGTFLPPVDLPRRMWAGSRIRYLHPVRVGSEAVRTSRIERIVSKRGKSGAMCFVTVAHTISIAGQSCIVEEQDIVYREAASPSVPPANENAPGPAASEVQSRWQRAMLPDSTLLFRYSALTFNGHRIHYDLPYARDVEHYPGLVVHGPLLATMLQGLAQSARPRRRLTAFEFRGTSPCSRTVG